MSSGTFHRLSCSPRVTLAPFTSSSPGSSGRQCVPSRHRMITSISGLGCLRASGGVRPACTCTTPDGRTNRPRNDVDAALQQSFVRHHGHGGGLQPDIAQRAYNSDRCARIQTSHKLSTRPAVGNITEEAASRTVYYIHCFGFGSRSQAHEMVTYSTDDHQRGDGLVRWPSGALS